jgi:hypothetical protein
MNAVEIDQAVSELFQQPFDAAEFPFQFLAAFDRNETALKRLRTRNTNRSDVPLAVLQRNHIHIATAPVGQVDAMIATLRASPFTASEKARYILATDGVMLHAEDVASGDVLSCTWDDFPNRFGFFLPLAGITTIQAVKESAFDIKATGRLNRLYIELLKDNADWRERRQDMNHFMARLIFCFFAEDTDIFHSGHKFTETVQRMSAPDSSNTHSVIETLFLAMNTPARDSGRVKAGTPTWAAGFPYVNGQLFSGDTTVPRFSRMARSYLLSIGSLNWREINPDIFGSMIQAVADDEERGSLGMHYTSVPNILKVLNPLFLDDLRTKFEEAGDNTRKLLNLRNRMACIRVFDPACGSGNFLVIAYKEMRKIEAAIGTRRGESDQKSAIPLTNFRGIELRDFPAEIARLALIIAEYQCDVLYRGQQEALAEFLPLDSENWITCGNALRVDWLSVCPPTGMGVKLHGDDLFNTPLDQAQIDFENEGGETYICGNPPYRGSTWQDETQKAELEAIFASRTNSWKSLDYVAGWFMKAADYGTKTNAASALVATNSICQGQQVPILWPLIASTGHEISFAYTSFKWANLANYNAGVTVVIVGMSRKPSKLRCLFSTDDSGQSIVKETDNISAYLVSSPSIIVNKLAFPLDDRAIMTWGNKPADGGGLLLDFSQRQNILREHPEIFDLIRPFPGAAEFIQGTQRFCLWISEADLGQAQRINEVKRRLDAVAEMRSKSQKAPTFDASKTPHRFVEVRQNGNEDVIVIPGISSENRPYLPCGIAKRGTILSNKNYAFFGAPLWNMALVISRLHLVWIATVCVRLRTDYSYSNTLGWNTFPVPLLTDQNKIDLTSCAENILVARECYFPATIADMYDPVRIDTEFPRVRAAHEANDKVLEGIYVGRRFKNDTERLEHLFTRYTGMTQADAAKAKTQKKATAHA